MKMSRKLICVFLCALLVCVFFSSCLGEEQLTSEQLIKNRINEFLTAYNSGDMDAVMDCLDAKTRNAMNAMLNLLGGFIGSQAGFGIDLRDLFSLGIAIESDDFMKLQITDITVKDSKTAVATTTMDLTGAGVETIYFHMVYENDGWYISDMSDKKGESAAKTTPVKA